MKLDPLQQELLLELANAQRTLDSGVPAKVSPEQETLNKLLEQQTRARDAAGAAQLAVDDMDNEILRIQEDERKLRRRKKDSQDSLGAEVDPERRRDLQHDVYAAKSRIADLMSELQEAHNEIHALRNNRDVNQTRVADLGRQVEEARKALDEANAAATEEDGPEAVVEKLTAALPTEVIEAYQEQRDENGVGVAFFNGRSCSGCSMVLPSNAQSAVRSAAPDVVPQCPECGSYLVRRAS